MVVEQRLPPPGFNFANATADQLQYYGVPANTPRSRMTGLSTLQIGSIQPRPDLPPAPSNFTNWTGELVRNSSAVGAASTYYEPSTVNWNQCWSPFHFQFAYYWAGLGGAGGSDLAQDGTAQGEWVNSAGQAQAEDGYIWYEFWPFEPGVEFMRDSSGNYIAFGEGHYVGAEVVYDAAHSTGTDWVFQLTWSDATTNKFISVDGFPPKSGFNWFPATSEWVVEHPGHAGDASTLLDFGSVTADASKTLIGSTWEFDNQVAADNMNMTGNDPSGYQATSTLSGNGSVSSWQGCSW